MTAATHTPGPWAFSESELTPGRFSIYHYGPLAWTVAGCADNGNGSENARANARLIAAAPEMLDALQRLVHPAADDTDLSHALDVIARATGVTVTPLDSPQARALEAWILENDLRNQRGPLGDSIMAAWLAEADSGQGIVEIPARWSVTGVPVTFNVWEAAP